MHDIQHQYGFALVSAPNKKTGKRYLFTETTSDTRRGAWDKIGGEAEILDAKKRGFTAVRVTIIPGVLKPQVKP